MNKMKRTLMTLLATVTLCGSTMGITSCGGDKVDYSKNIDVVAYDGSAVTVTFQHTMGKKLVTVLNNYITEFNALYPNITIEATSPTSDYDELREQISTGLTARNSPSVAFCYPDHVALYNTMNATVPLTDWASSDLTVTRADGTTETMGFTEAQRNDYYEQFYAEGSCYGTDTMYTLPWLKSTEVLYYNKTFFTQHADKGLKVPTTWDEMWEACKKIKEITNDDKVIPLGYDSESNWFITMTEQLGQPYTSATGGEKYLFNTETNRKFVEDLRKYYELDYFTTKTLNSGYTSALFDQGATNNQRCYMCIGSTGGSSYQVPEGDPFEVGVAMVPQVSTDTSKHKVIQQGPSVCLFKKNNPQEVAAAWLFIKFMTTSVGYQGESSMSNGYTPVIKSVMDNDIYRTWLENAQTMSEGAALPAKTVKQALDQAPYYYISPAFNGSSAARERVGAMFGKCLSAELTGGQTATDFIASCFSETIQTLKTKFSD